MPCGIPDGTHPDVDCLTPGDPPGHGEKMVAGEEGSGKAVQGIRAQLDHPVVDADAPKIS